MIRVGKVVAAHGLQGAVVLKHIVDNSKWLEKQMPLFLELQKKSYIPYFVEDFTVNNEEEYIVQLDDVDGVDAAKRLIGKHVYAEEDQLSKSKSDSPLLWIGFNLVDKTKGGLGVLEDVMQAGQNWIGQITVNSKEVLIPLAPEMILDVNMKNKFIRMDLPEGLIEVYLEG